MAKKSAKRQNAGKPTLSRILDFGPAIVGAIRVLEYSDKKYGGRDDWKQGYKHTEIVDSMQRHLTDWINGEDLDGESGLNHAFHILVNALLLAWNICCRPDLDDRPSSLRASSGDDYYLPDLCRDPDSYLQKSHEDLTDD